MSDEPVYCMRWDLTVSAIVKADINVNMVAWMTGIFSLLADILLLNFSIAVYYAVRAIYPFRKFFCDNIYHFTFLIPLYICSVCSLPVCLWICAYICLTLVGRSCTLMYFIISVLVFCQSAKLRSLYGLSYFLFIRTCLENSQRNRWRWQY